MTDIQISLEEVLERLLSSRKKTGCDRSELYELWQIEQSCVLYS